MDNVTHRKFKKPPLVTVRKIITEDMSDKKKHKSSQLKRRSKKTDNLLPTCSASQTEHAHQKFEIPTTKFKEHTESIIL